MHFTDQWVTLGVELKRNRVGFQQLFYCNVFVLFCFSFFCSDVFDYYSLYNCAGLMNDGKGWSLSRPLEE